MSDHEALIARLEKLTVPDREADAHIHAVAIGGRVHDLSDGEAVIERPIDGMWIRNVLPLRSRKIAAFTSSLDAAGTLKERLLPGWGWDVCSNTEHIKACIDPDLGTPVLKHPHWAAVANTSSKLFYDGATPAIALLIATLRALPSEAPLHGEQG